jgi:hypothetical protein
LTLIVSKSFYQRVFALSAFYSVVLPLNSGSTRMKAWQRDRQLAGYRLEAEDRTG